MRIGIALISIADLLIRGADLTAHYTDQGIWPINLVYNFGWNTGYWSLHTLNGSFNFELSLFILHFVFAICLLIGFKTRLFTILVWLLTISLHNRNVYVLQAGDDLLRLILMWGILIPWQAYYSMDSKLKPFKTKQNIYSNFGYLLLLASVYFFSTTLKTSNEWHSEGTAIYYALSLEQIRLPVGDWLYQFPGLLKVLTHLVFYTELALVVLILYPLKKGTSRFLAFTLLVIIHVGIGLTLYVGLFFLISIVSGIGLLPAFVMDRFDALLKLKKKVSLINQAKSNFTKWLNIGLCTFLIFFCLMTNLGSVNWFPYEMRNELTVTTNALRLNQYWGMFSPSVLKKDGWFVYYGRDSIGRQWDLRRNEDYVDFSKPKRLVSMYKSDRWRKLAENLQSDRYIFLRPLFCKYILHKWNKKHSKKKISSLSVYFMEKENLPNYSTSTPVKTLHCLCYDD
ncbi:HTTM domain-containing protein [Aurantibacillus circumpalustris]|uniref:HTTM domain-containing protein n=1 Tax=Aurantibacillus circumpalustris TaxID=3036359 RepID=UPI00295ACB11|nr:HTTM domain-containing protein [Aurantibacillus circumpalustris]